MIPLTLTDLWVQAGEESPVHRKHICSIHHWTPRQVLGVAQVDVVVLAGQLTQLVLDRVLLRQVVVEPHHPAGILGGNVSGVGGDAVQILLILYVGARFAVEGEGDDSLVDSPAVGVLATGSDVVQHGWWVAGGVGLSGLKGHYSVMDLGHFSTMTMEHTT